MQIVFFMFYRKILKNKQCVRPHDTYFLFITFFSQVNNKNYFFEIGHAPLTINKKIA